MNRIWSLAALVALLGLGALLAFTHSESAGQTQPPKKENADANELVKKLKALREEHEQEVKKLERKIKLLEAELKEARAFDQLAEARSEIAVLKRLPKVTATPEERAKVIAELRARLDKIDRELDEFNGEDMYPLERPGGAEEKKDDAEAANKGGRPAMDKKQLERHRRYTALVAERQRTMNFLLGALAVGPAQDRNLGIMTMLKEVVDTKALQEKVKLRHALEYLSDRFHGKLAILVDKEAFDNGPDAPDPYEEEVSLPEYPNKMPLSVALRLLLSQIGKGQATYQIRQGYIEITTLKNATAANALAGSLVTCSFDMRPLSEVLETLTAETGLDINVDPSVGKKGAALIKATFRNTTLEEALVTATEMAELKYVVLDRTVYVTTPEKAEVLRKEQKERDQRREKVRPANPDPRKRAESAP